ncbi:MAG: isoprenylcysteine carboxylmethyltransferase family protein [Bacteroidota bacterium]
MKKVANKDIIFVSIQLLLFVIYFIPVFTCSFRTNYIFRYASLSVAIIGFMIITLAILQLNKNLTPFPTPKENGTLIQNGLYKFVRHPIYTGIILLTVGFGFYRSSIWEISIGFALWILFYFKSKYEENLLAKHFDDYGKYKKTTGRFFPFIQNNKILKNKKAI